MLRYFRWSVLGVLITLVLLVIFTAYGSRDSDTLEFYQNTLLGISLEYPHAWNLEMDERVDNMIILESNGDLFQNDSVRIELFVGHPNSLPIDLDESLENSINSMSELYEAVHIIQSPVSIDSENYEIAGARIAIPTTSMPSDSPENQMADRSANVEQVVNMYVIRDEVNHFIAVKIFKGRSEELNAQAEDIVHSIRFMTP